MNTIISPRQSGKNTLLQVDADLRALTQKALTLAGEALKTGCDRTHETLVDVALTLDAAKDQLALDGLDYLDAAQAFVVAGRKTIDVLGTGLGIVRLREAVQS
ncbi:hypothetical protein [Microbacterium sp. Mcb102]|uniref:hypothetical protein n=1 Tax=Microbacterium sp. Mcb102 TaxID=2926012 RepID=UPI0021C70F73|nr:hypothetical protein [Microbacterium sp. Mcb102]